MCKKLWITLCGAILQTNSLCIHRMRSVLKGCFLVTDPLFFRPAIMAFDRCSCKLKSTSPLIRSAKRIASKLPFSVDAFRQGILLFQIRKSMVGSSHPCAHGESQIEMPLAKQNPIRVRREDLYDARPASAKPDKMAYSFTSLNRRWDLSSSSAFGPPHWYMYSVSTTGPAATEIIIVRWIAATYRWFGDHFSTGKCTGPPCPVNLAIASSPIAPSAACSAL